MGITAIEDVTLESPAGGQEKTPSRSAGGQEKTLSLSAAVQPQTPNFPAGGQQETPSLSIGDEAEFSLAICEHIKPSGTGCGSPALRDQKFCYYHSKVRKTVPKNNLFVFLDNPGRKENDPYDAFEFPYLEDAAAVQIGFMQFIYGVAQHRLEEWRARMILPALHGAAANLRLMEASSAASERPRPSQTRARTGHPAQPERKRPANAPSGEIKEEETA